MVNKFRGQTVSITPFANAPTLVVKESVMDDFDSLFSAIEEKKQEAKASQVIASTSAAPTSTNAAPIDDLFDSIPQESSGIRAPTQNPFFIEAVEASSTQAPTESSPIAKLSIDELFQRHLRNKSISEDVEESKKHQNEEIVLFSKLDMNNVADREKWAMHLFQLSQLATEVRDRFAKASALGRESDAKAGRTIWDRERRGTNAFNGSMKLLHQTDAEVKQEKEIKKHKTNLSKMEKSIKDFLSLGEDEDSLLKMFVKDGKYSAEQVKGMIKRAKGEE